MSIVQPVLVGASVLDLFAGSGALGLEALSRGALHVDFVEQAAASLRALHANIDTLGAGDRARVHRADAIAFMTTLAPGAYDVAFADPPYGHGLAGAVAARWLQSPFAAVIGIEHARTEMLPRVDDRAENVRHYGSTSLTFYRRSEAT
jgi:16S rRNA (guanine966-N2)-methyltransferase